MQQITMSVDDIEEIVKRRIKRAMERPVPTLLHNLCNFYPFFSLFTQYGCSPLVTMCVNI